MQTGEKCIAVTATSSVASAVKFYTGDLGADGLEPYVKLTIEQGTGGSFTGGCGAFTSETTPVVESPESLATLAADHSSWATATLPWSKTAGSVTKTYKFSWQFDTSSLTQTQIDALQGHGASINFEWELQNS